MPKVCVHPRRKEVKPRVKKFSKKWKKRTKVSRPYITLRLLRGITFIVCLTLFFYQSAKFLQVYYTYPTITKVELTSPTEFELPAITFCNTNRIKRTKFCTEYPDLCQSPENITAACKMVPSACKHNVSDLVIPKLGVLANDSREEVNNAIQEIYYSGNVTKEFWEEWVWSIKTRRIIKPVFIVERSQYHSCFTENLLLNCTDEPKKMKVDLSKIMGRYDLNLQHSENIIFGVEPQVIFSVHSPFVPVSALEEGNILRVGHKYNIYIKLEEVNLLPFPYETDCITYEDSWDKRNPQRPRSQEMCKDLCFHRLLEQNKNMSLERGMLFEYPMESCFGWKCQTSPEDKEILERCRRNCKPSCRNLKYTSTVDETTLDKPTKTEIQDLDYDRDIIQVQIYLKDREVLVSSHVAVYDTGDLFSYIGGLMGCWLGISIWAFAGIAENVLRRALQWMEQIKLYLKNTSQAPHTVFEPQRNRMLKIKNF